MKPRILIGIVLLLLVAAVVWMMSGRGDSKLEMGEDSDGRRPTLQGGENTRGVEKAREREEKSVVSGESSVGEDRDRNVPAPLAPPVERMAALGAPPAGARVKVGGKAYDLVPNQLGEFQRVYLEKGGSAEVTVRYPEGKPGDKVAVAILDGGTVSEVAGETGAHRAPLQGTGENGAHRAPLQGTGGIGAHRAPLQGTGETGAHRAPLQGTALALELDKSLALNFTAQTTDEGGMTRVLLTKGGDRKIIDLWGGTESPLKSEISAE